MTSIKVTYTLDDTTAGNFNYDTGKIEFTPTGAKLKLVTQPNRFFTQGFTNDTGFTYDSTKTEFVGGEMQQIDKALANSLSWATYTTNIDLNYGGGVTTGSSVGGAAVVSNRLDLKGATVKYVNYDAVDNADMYQTGTIRFKLTPNYSGAPLTNKTFIVIAAAAGNTTNLIWIYHQDNDDLKVMMRNSIDNQIYNNKFGDWLPTASQTYEIEFNFDLTTGAHRLFIDGIQFGITVNNPGTRSGTITQLRVGSDNTGVDTSDFEIEDLVIFSTVQHTTNYTPGYTLEEYRYLEDLVTIPQFSYVGDGNLVSYDGFTTTQIGLMRMNINGNYWDGAAWSASDDSYAQMNDPATINANIGTLSVIDTIDIKIRSINGSTQESIDQLQVEYTGFCYPSDNPTIEFNTGILADGINAWLENSVVKPVNTELKYILPRTPDIWHNGILWTPSNGTYAESNTASEIDANVSTLDISSGATLKFVAFLNSDGGFTPTVNELELDYDFFALGNVPNQCIVWGYLRDKSGLPIADAIVRAERDDHFFHSDNNLIVTNVETTTNSTGFFELTLVETETIEEFMNIRIIPPVGSSVPEELYTHVVIPNLISVELTSIIDDENSGQPAYYKAGTYFTAQVDPSYIKGWFTEDPE